MGRHTLTADRVRALAASGKTCAEAADACGVKYHTMYAAAKRYSVRFALGYDPRNAKLSRAQRMSLVRSYVAGQKTSDIARRYGVDVSAVYYHLRAAGVARRGLGREVYSAAMDAEIREAIELLARGMGRQPRAIVSRASQLFYPRANP